MPKNRDSMETVHLTIELLRRIPRDSKITAPELQRQLAAAGYERDLRSIQRHLRQITEHFDVECDDRGKPYGYRWKVKAKGLSLPGMSQQESLLVDRWLLGFGVWGGCVGCGEEGVVQKRLI